MSDSNKYTVIYKGSKDDTHDLEVKYWQEYIKLIKADKIDIKNSNSCNYFFKNKETLFQSIKDEFFVYEMQLKDALHNDEIVSYYRDKFPDDNYYFCTLEWIFVDSPDDFKKLTLDEIKDLRRQGYALVYNDIWNQFIKEMSQHTDLYLWHYAFDDVIGIKEIKEAGLEHLVYHLGDDAIMKYFDHEIVLDGRLHEFIDICSFDIYLVGFKKGTDLKDINKENADDYISYLEFMGNINNDYGYADIVIKNELHKKIFK
ncbi:hypothetical protein BK010_00525 [Tenericutes bacterium MO-XQ]|nr:hypothetical protein BK010_00525 [Tenericutes bacterium MO-XQ]